MHSVQPVTADLSETDYVPLCVKCGAPLTCVEFNHLTPSEKRYIGLLNPKLYPIFICPELLDEAFEYGALKEKGR